MTTAAPILNTFVLLSPKIVNGSNLKQFVWLPYCHRSVNQYVFNFFKVILLSILKITKHRVHVCRGGRCRQTADPPPPTLMRCKEVQCGGTKTEQKCFRFKKLFPQTLQCISNKYNSHDSGFLRNFLSKVCSICIPIQRHYIPIAMGFRWNWF